jgi:hypothetical protein
MLLTQPENFVVFTTVEDEYDSPRVVGMLLSDEPYNLYNAYVDKHVGEFLEKSNDIDFAIFLPVNSFEEFNCIIEEYKENKGTMAVAGFGPFSKEDLGISNWSSIVNFQN